MSTRPLPGQATVGLATKADKIRALAHAGYLRTEIAAELEIRYQHVRQVLERSGIGLGRQQDAGGVRASPRTAVPAKGPRQPATNVMSELVPVSRLLEAGFVRLGEWTLTAAEAFALDSPAPTDAGVYAFVVDSTVCYIGLTHGGGQ